MIDPINAIVARDYSPAGDEVLHYCSAAADQLEYQQNVNESAEGVAGDNAQQPQHQQHYKQGPKHSVTSEFVPRATTDWKPTAAALVVCEYLCLTSQEPAYFAAIRQPSCPPQPKAG